jgi:hypothetical protein
MLEENWLFGRLLCMVVNDTVCFVYYVDAYIEAYSRFQNRFPLSEHTV